VGLVVLATAPHHTHDRSASLPGNSQNLPCAFCPPLPFPAIQFILFGVQKMSEAASPYRKYR
jgi:hypothetical protein